ncbi:acetylornithine aminotransferase [Pichia californica]|uniref:Acetylornithine aminotransferase, mitochondrial n=1 Tax=Pichia californica TaxID=460514 RepID=A0A9P7BHC7_9ASCO|nr:acetylornithine aminotransferase [[Candida] californica]KAG0689268.1 acetylornithine aminotransferase [[Candida] californica]
MLKFNKLSKVVSTTISKRLISSKDFLSSHVPFEVTTYARPDFILASAKGSYLYDLDQKKYIDFTAGIAVVSLGHSDAEIAKIMFEQASTLMHSSNLYHNPWTLELSKQLVDKTIKFNGMHDASRVFLCNSGTEANEAALKFARKHGKSISPNKTEFITFKTSFHGRTMGALSVTPNPKYQAPFSPLIPGVHVATPNDIESVKSLINENTCGVIIEPIQGEGGVHPMKIEFLTELKQLCKDNKAVLIYDEIQCGMGRSGTLWAHSKLPKEAHPDIVTMAKALGNGFPIGATMISEDVEKVLKVGDHGTTFGGNPLACRIGCNVLDRIANEEFLNNVNKKSDILKAKLLKLKEKYNDEIIEVRGQGLILGLQCKENPSKIVAKAQELGLLVITAGGNVIRFVPPLNIEEETIEEGIQILDKAFAETLTKQ